jgi:hypothetical protein
LESPALSAAARAGAHEIGLRVNSIDIVVKMDGAVIDLSPSHPMDIDVTMYRSVIALAQIGFIQSASATLMPTEKPLFGTVFGATR